MATTGNKANAKNASSVTTDTLSSSSTSSLELCLRTKDSLFLQNPFGTTTTLSANEEGNSNNNGSPSTLIKTEFDASNCASVTSKDGRLQAVTDKEGIDIYRFIDSSTSSSTATVTVPTLLGRIPQSGVTALHFSPKGSLLLTWHRKKAEEANLLVWSIVALFDSNNNDTSTTTTGSTIIPLIGFHYKNYAADMWPPLKWSNDEGIAARLGNDEVQIYDGLFRTSSSSSSVSSTSTVTPTDAATVGSDDNNTASSSSTHPVSVNRITPIARIAVNNVGQVYLGPPVGGAEGKYTIVTFTPRTKSRPAAALVWAYPKVNEPTTSKSLQADECVVAFSPDGASVLIELSTSSSESSYYGDSRLFLLSRDGRLNNAIQAPKEGPTHDFAWGTIKNMSSNNNAATNNANTDYFIVIAGKSPPAATMYNKQGAVLFSFGTNAHNTVRISPNGRVVMLAGYGNMAGNMWFWDIQKQKLLGPVVSAPCTVNADWAPDSRHFLTATLRPRLQVDNGYRVWDYHGNCVVYQPHSFLFQAEWRPRLPSSFPDRAPSPDRAKQNSNKNNSNVTGNLSNSNNNTTGNATNSSSTGLSSSSALTSTSSSSSSTTVMPNNSTSSSSSTANPPTNIIAPKPVGVYRPPGARGGAALSEISAIMKGGSSTASNVTPASSNTNKSIVGNVPLGGQPVVSTTKRRRRRNKKKGETANPNEGNEDNEDDEGED